MQILSHTYELNIFLDKGDYRKKLNQVADSVILLEWDKLRSMLWQANCTVAPYGFVKAIQKTAAKKQRDIFTGHAQNDVQEFLLFIIECLHTALAREVDMQINGQAQNPTDNLATLCYTMMKNMYKKEYSEMLGIFYGIHVSEILSAASISAASISAASISGASISAATLSSTPEPFSVLSLSIPKNNPNPTIYDCLDLYCEPEQLVGENAWFNSATQQKEPAQRRIIFWSLPNIMIIDLKRWNGSRHKNQQLVQAPLSNADFSKYVKGYQASTYVYDLYGVCNHSGGVSGGHYTAFIKNANGKWYEMNDTNVREIKEDQIISPRSYCLFYRKSGK
jgi:ubiquitin C-terminal hydrolase